MKPISKMTVGSKEGALELNVYFQEGNFAITRIPRYEDQYSNEDGEEFYSVTHIPSGKFVLEYIYLLLECKNLIEELNKFDTGKREIPQKHLKAMAELTGLFENLGVIISADGLLGKMQETNHADKD